MNRIQRSASRHGGFLSSVMLWIHRKTGLEDKLQDRSVSTTDDITEASNLAALVVDDNPRPHEGRGHP